MAAALAPVTQRRAARRRPNRPSAAPFLGAQPLPHRTGLYQKHSGIIVRGERKAGGTSNVVDLSQQRLVCRRRRDSGTAANVPANNHERSKKTIAGTILRLRLCGPVAQWRVWIPRAIAHLSILIDSHQRKHISTWPSQYQGSPDEVPGQASGTRGSLRQGRTTVIAYAVILLTRKFSAEDRSPTRSARTSRSTTLHAEWE